MQPYMLKTELMHTLKKVLIFILRELGVKWKGSSVPFSRLFLVYSIQNSAKIVNEESLTNIFEVRSPATIDLIFTDPPGIRLLKRLDPNWDIESVTC